METNCSVKQLYSALLKPTTHLEQSGEMNAANLWASTHQPGYPRRFGVHLANHHGQTAWYAAGGLSKYPDRCLLDLVRKALIQTPAGSPQGSVAQIKIIYPPLALRPRTFGSSVVSLAIVGLTGVSQFLANSASKACVLLCHLLATCAMN